MRVATKIHPDKLVGLARGLKGTVWFAPMSCVASLISAVTSPTTREIEGDEDDGDDPAGSRCRLHGDATGKKQVTARSQRGEGSSSKGAGARNAPRRAGRRASRRRAKQPGWQALALACVASTATEAHT